MRLADCFNTPTIITVYFSVFLYALGLNAGDLDIAGFKMLGQKPYVEYEGGPKENEIREERRKFLDNKDKDENEPHYKLLAKRYHEYFEIYEKNNLTCALCHQYALAVFFGYKEELPKWIKTLLTSPKDFDADKYLTPTQNPQNGDLAIYYDSADLLTKNSQHVGFYFNGKIVSTWGYGYPVAAKHSAFFVPKEYGKYIVFYTNSLGGKSLKEIESKVIEDHPWGHWFGL